MRLAVDPRANPLTTTRPAASSRPSMHADLGAVRRARTCSTTPTALRRAAPARPSHGDRATAAGSKIAFSRGGNRASERASFTARALAAIGGQRLRQVLLGFGVRQRADGPGDAPSPGRDPSGNRSTACREAQSQARALHRATASRRRAAATRLATALEGSPAAPPSSVARGRGSATTRSKRSSNAPESFSRKAASLCAEH